MSTSFSPFLSAFLGKALDSGMGKWLNVDTVCCGRHSVGFHNSLNTFSVPEMFIVRGNAQELHTSGWTSG